MKWSTVLAFLAASGSSHIGALAQDDDNPVDIDWALVTKLEPRPKPYIPIVYRTVPDVKPITFEIVQYNPAQAIIFASRAIQKAFVEDIVKPIFVNPRLFRAGPASFTKRAIAATPTPTSDQVLRARHDTWPGHPAPGYDPIPRCVVQPRGPGPVPDEDTPEGFRSYGEFSWAANSAVEPAGYVEAYKDLKASSNAYGYMGYHLLPKYDVNLCAEKCNSAPGCKSFNIYFERDPMMDPNNASCSNPPSTTNIKCVLWGGNVAISNAVNTGERRMKFEVVIAGSNGYVNRTTNVPEGYADPHYLGARAINAPPPCRGRPSRLLQSNVFVASSFDIGLCATACSQQRAWAVGRPGMRQCGFFDTYILYKNQRPVGQYCAMYDEIWVDKHATNDGFRDRDDVYTIGFSYSSWNKTGARVGDTCRRGSGRK